MPVLDGVRGVAILLVLIAHAIGRRADYASTIIGDAGVSLFFVLSGYLITRNMLADEGRNGRLRLARFYWRRALRIFPAFYVYLACIGALAVIGVCSMPDRRSWLAAVFYLRNLYGSGDETAHLWSLALEEQFYFLWPTLFIVTKRFRLQFVALAVAAFTLHRVSWLHTHVWIINSTGGYHVRPDLRLDTLLIGAAFALVRWAWVGSIQPILICGASALWYAICFTVRWPVPIDTPVSALLLGMLVLWAVKAPRADPLVRLLSSRLMVWLGVSSYSIYLWQEIFLVGRSLHWWTFPGIAIAASASYFFIEQPFLRMKKRART